MKIYNYIVYAALFQINVSPFPVHEVSPDVPAANAAPHLHVSWPAVVSQKKSPVPHWLPPAVHVSPTAETQNQW